MADSAFEKFISAFDTSAKREEMFGRNFFADAMDANRVNNLMLNDAVTRAFNQQTIDQRDKQFPVTMAGLNRANEIADLMHPAMKDLTGVQAKALTTYSSDPQGYMKLLTDNFGANNANKQIELTNAQSGVKQSAFSKDYLDGNLEGIASHIGVDPGSLWRAPSGLIVHTDTTGKQTVVQPTMFNIAMNQQKVKSDQVMAGIAAAQAALHPTGAAGYGTPAGSNVVIGTRSFPVRSDTTPAVDMTAPTPVPNTPGIKDAAGMTPMMSQANADMLRMVNRGTAPTPVPSTPGIKDAAGMTPTVSQGDSDMLRMVNRGTGRPNDPHAFAADTAPMLNQYNADPLYTFNPNAAPMMNQVKADQLRMLIHRLAPVNPSDPYAHAAGMIPTMNQYNADPLGIFSNHTAAVNPSNPYAAAADMTPMMSQADADMLASVNRSMATVGPEEAKLDAHIARLVANGLDPSEAIAQRVAAAARFAAAQKATAASEQINREARRMSAVGGYQKMMDTRELIRMGLNSSKLGHVKLSGPDQTRLVEITQRDPGLAEAFGVTPSYLDALKRFNAMDNPKAAK